MMMTGQLSNYRQGGGHCAKNKGAITLLEHHSTAIVMHKPSSSIFASWRNVVK